MTYVLSPVDAHEGPVLWIKITILTIGGIVIPGIMPWQYVPVNYEVCAELFKS